MNETKKDNKVHVHDFKPLALFTANDLDGSGMLFYCMDDSCDEIQFSECTKYEF